MGDFKRRFSSLPQGCVARSPVQGWEERAVAAPRNVTSVRGSVGLGPARYGSSDNSDAARVSVSRRTSRLARMAFGKDCPASAASRKPAADDGHKFDLLLGLHFTQFRLCFMRHEPEVRPRGSAQWSAESSRDYDNLICLLRLIPEYVVGGNFEGPAHALGFELERGLPLQRARRQLLHDHMAEARL